MMLLLAALRSSRLIVLGRRGHGPAFLSTISSAASSAGRSSNTHTNYPRQRFALGIAGGVVVASLGSVAYLNEYLGGSEGLLRTVSFYSLAIPKYITYRYHMIMNSPDEVWDTLHRETSKAGLAKIMELQGFYVKSGQMAAANIGNAFPPIWQETMAPLQDACPAQPFHVVKAIIEKEYGKNLDQVFTSIDESPIGAASIGQVHRAILKSNGHHVVVKIMYPGVEDVFRGDVRTIKMFCEVAQPVHVPPLLEIEKQFMTEFDYTREAQQLDQVRKNMLAAKLAGDSYKLCAIPKPYLEFCTKQVLVMDELIGGKLTDELKKNTKRQMARVNVTDEKTMKEKLFTKSNKNGPTSREYDVYIKTIDLQRRLTNLHSVLYNFTVGWLPGVNKKSYESKSSLPINHAKLIDDLLHIHGHQILVDGCFNGDPHPGNILLLGVEDGRPQLGLIDYGQVKVLSKEERLLFCKLIIALADDDREQICNLMKDAGYKSKHMDSGIIYKYARVGYDEDNEEFLEGQHIQLFMDHLHALDPVEKVPEQFIMASRVSIILRGLAHAVHQSRSVAKAWKPIAVKALKDAGQV